MEPTLSIIISTACAILVSTITYIGVRHTIRQNNSLKSSDFQNEWLNNLRTTMAEFQSYGITPGLDHSLDRKFYELGTKIELLMDPGHPEFENLRSALYNFLNASDTKAKFACNDEYVRTCQSILQSEWLKIKNALH